MTAIPEGAYPGSGVLDVMAVNAPRRNAAVARLIRRHLGNGPREGPIRLIDFGAGKGEFLKGFHGAPGVEAFAVEPDASFHAQLRCLGIYRDVAELPDASFDFIYSVDVLEHVEDDAACLRGLRRALKPGGGLFLYVPAGPELFSSFDRAIGHWRRYTRKGLRERLHGAGFRVETARYHDCLGYFAAWYNKLRPYRGNLEPGLVRLYDGLLFPVGNVLETAVPAPFGKSLYAFARATGSG